MASNSESKNGSNTGEEEERQNQVFLGEGDSKETEIFNWTEFHLFVSSTENEAKVNAYTEDTQNSFKSIAASKGTIESYAAGPKPKPIVVAFTGKNTITVLHNIHILKGGEVVGIQGTRLYSPYRLFNRSR